LKWDDKHEIIASDDGLARTMKIRVFCPMTSKNSVLRLEI